MIPIIDFPGPNNFASRSFRFFDSHSCALFSGNAPGSLFAHFQERPGASLVPRSARLDTLPNPDLLLFEFLVELRVFPGFVFQIFFFMSQILMVVTGPTRQFTPVDIQNPGRQALQKCTVMCDEDDGARIGIYRVLEPLYGDDIQVICRLIQQ